MKTVRVNVTNVDSVSVVDILPFFIDIVTLSGHKGALKFENLFKSKTVPFSKSP